MFQSMLNIIFLWQACTVYTAKSNSAQMNIPKRLALPLSFQFLLVSDQWLIRVCPSGPSMHISRWLRTHYQQHTRTSFILSHDVHVDKYTFTSIFSAGHNILCMDVSTNDWQWHKHEVKWQPTDIVWKSQGQMLPGRFFCPNEIAKNQADSDK